MGGRVFYLLIIYNLHINKFCGIKDLEHFGVVMNTAAAREPKLVLFLREHPLSLLILVTVIPTTVYIAIGLSATL